MRGMMRYQNELERLAARQSIDEQYYRTHARTVITDDEQLQRDTERIAAINLDEATISLAQGKVSVPVMESIEEAEARVKDFLKREYFNPWYISRCLEIAMLGKKLNSILEDKIEQISQEMKDAPPSLHGIKDAPTNMKKYVGVVEMAERRAVPLPPDVRQGIAHYKEHMEWITGLQNTVEALFTIYGTVDVYDAKGMRELEKGLQNAEYTRKKGENCMDKDFLAILRIVSVMQNEIHYLQKNKQDVAREKKQIRKDVEKLEDEYRHFREIDVYSQKQCSQKKYSPKDIILLEAMQKELSHKYAVDKYQKTPVPLYIKTEMQEYSALRDGLERRITEKLNGEGRGGLGRAPIAPVALKPKAYNETIPDIAYSIAESKSNATIENEKRERKIKLPLPALRKEYEIVAFAHTCLRENIIKNAELQQYCSLLAGIDGLDNLDLRRFSYRSSEARKLSLHENNLSSQEKDVYAALQLAVERIGHS